MESSSPFNCYQCPKSPRSKTVCENVLTEKGETDSLYREYCMMESDEGEELEPEVPSKEKRFKKDSPGVTFKHHKKGASFPRAEDVAEGMKIMTSVTIDDNNMFSSEIIFQQSHELEHRHCGSSGVSVTMTKIRCTGSSVKVEIKEVLHSDKSDIETTFVVQDRRGKRKEATVKNQWDPFFSTNNEKLTHTYPSGQNSTTYWDNRISENYKFSITEIDKDFKEVTKDTVSSKHFQEETHCSKMGCEDKVHNCQPYHHDDTYPKAREGTSNLQQFQFYSQGRDLPSPSTIFNEVFSDIPPPQEFADRNCHSLEDLTQDVASCHISLSDTFDGQGGVPSSLAESDGTRYDVSSSRQYSMDGENYTRGAFFQQLSESDTYDPLFMEPKMITSRSSFTKDFIHNHEGKTWLRNNSIGIIETNPKAEYFLDKQLRRRQTFPGMEDCSSKMQESLPLHRQSISSGTISPFFMQSLPLQATRSGRIYMEEERPFGFCPERRKSSESSNSYKPTPSHFNGDNTFVPTPSSYNKIKNSQVKSEDLLSDFRQYTQKGQTLYDNMDNLDIVFQNISRMDAADRDSYGVGPMDQSEVAESGFDEEMAETEDHNEAFVEEYAQRNLLIQVIPPSRSTSQDLLTEDGTTLSRLPQQKATGTNAIPRKTTGSVVTVVTGGCEQRSLQNDPEIHQEDTFSTVHKGTSVSPTVDVDDMDSASNSDAPLERKSFPPRVFNTETNSASKTTIKTKKMQGSSEEQTEMTAAAQNGRKTSIAAENEEIAAVAEQTGSTAGLQEKLTTDETELQKTDSAKKLILPTTPVEIKVDVKEHLKPPESVLKDQEDAPDRWAKRRKLFKESRQWSSAGGSSITSNITEESMNSEDNRSVDLSMRDIEDRGFYTETFHFASWIFRGDDVHPKDSPRCLSNRPRPVTIRERTVKINKGVGDYPWGFRIQFSKPIVVTEVDTNGAAEEAGLQVGDYVLSVNGTDVTSVPHSEAADLARQGPDLLTLTIGSDISRLPNTPRPACRGYLHKRTQSGFLKGWRKRWFVLKHNCCLYYYRHKKDEGKNAPLSSIKLEGAEVGPDSSLGKPFAFKCCPLSSSRVYYFCATSNQEMKRWLEAMERAVHPVTQNHVWIDVTRHNSNLPPLAIKTPECLGLLHQMDKTKDVWVQHYCILKDGCLYLYASIRSTYALGGIYLHGYTVKEQPFGSRRTTIELKPPSEEFKTFYLCAENAAENKRWISALKASISKWVPLHQAIQDFMNRPPEETRM